jgi:hypothetical protein
MLWERLEAQEQQETLVGREAQRLSELLGLS